jgi:ADP-ribose pyrophosphatase YjhB (NUDIX family)
MKREYPEQPIVGVGGIIFQGESVLLIKRGKEPALGQWSIPGGVVDLGETLQAAVAREIREETHIEAEPLALVKVLDRIFRDKEGRVTYHYVLVDFLCRFAGGEVRPGSDALEARFVPVAELASLNVIPATRDVIHQAAKLLKNLRAWDQVPHLRVYDDLRGDRT